MTSNAPRNRIAMGAFVSSCLAASALGQTTHVIQQIAQGFYPHHARIDVGDVVEWSWTASKHTVIEGTDGTIDGSELFYFVLTQTSPDHRVHFTPEFLLAHPRPGNKYDFVCDIHLQCCTMKGQVEVEFPRLPQWTFATPGTVGSAGVPILQGSGSGAAGTTNLLYLSDARPASPSMLFVSVGAQSPLPAFGGILGAWPPALVLPFTTTPAGEVLTGGKMPQGIATGSLFSFQFAISDPTATAGVALSNSIALTTP